MVDMISAPTLWMEEVREKVLEHQEAEGVHTKNPTASLYLHNKLWHRIGTPRLGARLVWKIESRGWIKNNYVNQEQEEEQLGGGVRHGKFLELESYCEHLGGSVGVGQESIGSG